jgi:raffinose/stachyose/melibiose transport system permease protein
VTAMDGSHIPTLATEQAPSHTANMTVRESHPGLLCYGFAAPALILFLLFIAYPILWVISSSVTNASGSFQPLAAYQSVLRDPVFWTALRNMGIWGVITIPVQMVVGGLIAYFVEYHTKRFRAFFRTMFFLPVVTSVSVISIVWAQIYAPYYGLGQAYLQYFGIQLASSPLGDTRLAIYALVVVNIWQWMGFSMLMYVAGLGNIPSEVMDAAKVDGATGWRLGMEVIVPMLSPVTRSLLLLGILGTLQTFPIVQLMTGGGPDHASEVFGTLIFRESFVVNDVQKGAALSVIVLLLALVLSLTQIAALGARLAPTKGTA